MPLPMALGTVVMMVVAVVQMFIADVVLAVVGLLVFPAVVAANLLYQRYALAADDPRPGPPGRGERDRARVLRRRDGRQGWGARSRRPTDSAKATSCAVNVRAGQIRAVFDPALASLPSLGVLVVLAVGVARVSSGETRPATW